MPNRRTPAGEHFSPSELRVLWYLKRHGGKISAKIGEQTLYNRISEDTGMVRGTLRAALRDLEKASVVIRHFKRAPTGFGDGAGINSLLAIELVDPKMQLPPEPKLSLGYVVAYENNEMLERTAHEPDATQMLDALVDRCMELQRQIDKLGEIINKLNEENASLKKRGERKPPPEHLTSRIKDVLSPEQWEAMRHDST